MAENGGSGGGLRAIIREEFDDYMKDVLALPEEFVAWMPQRVELVGIQTPRSNVIGAYTTAATVGGLGEAVHGRPTTVRAGSSPYHFVQMTFDEVYDKWISSQVWFSFQISGSATINTAAPSYGDLAVTDSARAFIPGFKALYDAGLRPQVFIASKIANNATPTTIRLRAALAEVSDADTSTTDIGTTDPVERTAAGTGYEISSGWQAVTLSAPTKDHAYLKGQGNTSGGAGTAAETAFVMRWVADPV